MDKIAIFIKTLIREKAIFNCIKAIESNLQNVDYRIYIADDGPVSERKMELYNNLEKKGHVVKKLDLGMGASACRNLLLGLLKDEDYILRMDDDFEITEETDILSMMKILSEDSSVGAVADLERQVGPGKGVFSGEINTWQGFFIEKGNILIKKIIPLKKFQYKNIGNVYYANADFTRNMILLRKELFDELKWENRLKFSWEHEDLLLQIKKSKWDIVFTTSSIHLHREDLNEEQNDETYNLIRNKHNFDDAIFFKKWGFDKQKISRPVTHKIKAGFVKLKRRI